MLNFPNNSQVSHNQMPDGFQTAFFYSACITLVPANKKQKSPYR